MAQRSLSVEALSRAALKYCPEVKDIADGAADGRTVDVHTERSMNTLMQRRFHCQKWSVFAPIRIILAVGRAYCQPGAWGLPFLRIAEEPERVPEADPEDRGHWPAAHDGEDQR